MPKTIRFFQKWFSFMNYLNINLPWNFFKIWDFKRRVMMKKNLCLLFQLLNSCSFPIILYVFSFANYLLVVAFWSIPTVTTSLVLRVSWLVRPAEILLLSYSSLALDFSFFVLGKHHLKHTIFLPSIDQIVPSIWSLNCSPTSELPDHVERYSRKVFVGGLPPDIDEG